MALVEMNWRPDRKQLRDFGDVAMAMLTLIALIGYGLDRLAPAAAIRLCGAGLAVYALSRFWTPAVKPIYIALMAGAFPIGWVVSHIVMALFYYGVLTPIGLIFRLIGRDPLDRRRQAGRESYWTPHRPSDSAKRYFQQF